MVLDLNLDLMEKSEEEKGCGLDLGIEDGKDLRGKDLWKERQWSIQQES